jgi:AcrR family transcriptional regulator
MSTPDDRGPGRRRRPRSQRRRPDRERPDRERPDRERSADRSPRRREAARQPIWARPEPGARRTRLSRDQIAAEAVRIADADGIEAVSMRNVAAALGVGTMSLYYYVRTKDELLDLMSDAMMAEVLIPDGELPSDWRSALEAIGLRTGAALRGHSWALDLPPTAPGPNAMRHFDQTLAAVAGLPVDFKTKFEIISMLDDYVFGFVLREAQDERERAAQDPQTLEAIADYFESQVAAGHLSYTELLSELGHNVHDVIQALFEFGSDEGRFPRGLARLLDGIALDLERRGLSLGST